MLSTLKKAFTNFSFRLYWLYFLMVGGSAWFIAQHSLQALETSVNQVAEEVLVDTSQLLAELAEQDIQAGKINTERFAKLMPAYLQRRFQAQIYEHQKSFADLHIYLTDKKGIVLYDSTGQSQGEDFSDWHDVFATLQGHYGARVSPLDYHANKTIDIDKGLFIAAPIRDDTNSIIGVLTVVKASRNLGDYLLLSNRQVIVYAIAVFIVSLVAGLFLMWWLWRSITKLSRYAKQLGRGEYVAQPRIIHSEFKPLANAVERMYQDLAGKEYVENYVHTMAHELKSPLTGIIAATELLQQDLPPTARQQFTDSIHDAATRMSTLIERLLHLATLEKRNALDEVKPIHLAQIMTDLLAERQWRIDAKKLRISTALNDKATLHGEPTLIAQSLANLLDNAIDFSHQGSEIKVTSKTQQYDDKSMICVQIHDGGDGIADFAQKRLFERFFSTPRPDTQQRSSGLGLAFVKEAVTLHSGSIQLSNHKKGGAVATLCLPL